MTPLQGILLACLSTEFDMPMPCKQDSHSMTSTRFSANCWLSTTFRGRTKSKVCGGTPWKLTLPITRFVRGDQVAPLRRMLLVLPDLDTPCSKSGISIGRSPFRSVAFVCPRNAHWFSSIAKVNTLYKYNLYIPKRTWSMAKMSTTKGPAREVNINEATWQTTQKHNKVESTNLWYSPSKRTFVLQRNIPNEYRSQTRRSSPRNGNWYFKARWNWAKWRIQNAINLRWYPRIIRLLVKSTVYTFQSGDVPYLQQMPQQSSRKPSQIFLHGTTEDDEHASQYVKHIKFIKQNLKFILHQVWSWSTWIFHQGTT